MSKEKQSLSVAVDVAHARAPGADDGISVLSTGVRAVLKPVSASLIEEVTSRIEEPEVPKWFDPNKEREEENPTDPNYLREVAEVTRLRGLAAFDAMLLFGVELVDPIPDNGWESRLSILGISVNKDDEFERKFAYIKYIAVSSSDMDELSRLSGVQQSEVDDAVNSFPSD